jgi:hypothetical protein
MPYKVTIFIKINNYTVTETHYDVSAASDATAFANATQLCLLRSKFLGYFASIAACRVLNVATPRDATFLALSTFVSRSGFPDDSGSPTDRAGTNSSDRAYSALMLGLRGLVNTGPTSPSARKKIYLAGIPDEVIGESDSSGTSGIIDLGAIQSYVIQYILYLSQLYAFRAGSYPGSAGVPVQALVSNAGFPGELGVQFAAPLTFTQGLKIHLSGFRAVNPRQRIPQGNFAVDPLSPAVVAPSVTPSVYYLQNTANILPANAKIRGFGWPLNYQYFIYQNAIKGYQATHRKRGARALAPVGRARIHY